MNPTELGFRLRNLVEGNPHLDLTANTFLQLVKPTEELLLPYLKVLEGNKRRIIILLVLFFPRILINVFKSIAICFARYRENESWNSQRVFSRRWLFISHFTHAQRPHLPDVHYGKLLNRSESNVFYLNSTRIHHRALSTIFPQEERGNLVFMTKSLKMKKVLGIHASSFLISLKLLRLSFHRSYDYVDRWLLIAAGIHQHSRSTMANKFFENRISALIDQIKPSRVYLTFEGHAHEAVLIELIKRKFSHIEITPYQHAPVVPDQIGLLRNLSLLRVTDRVFTSGEITKDYFESFRNDILVTEVGSAKFKKIDGLPVRKRIKVIGASEGNVLSLISFLNLFALLRKEFPAIDFSIRVHPSVPNSVVDLSLKSSMTDNSLISKLSLEDDLLGASYCIYQSSAVAIEGLIYGVTPLYFNQSGSQGLNPLYLASLHLPVFVNTGDFIDFFNGVLNLKLTNQGIGVDELNMISNRYFSEIGGGFPR